MASLFVGETRDIYNPNSMTFDERARQLEKIEKEERETLRREKNSPFSRWTQFNLEHTKKLMWLSLNHPKAHAILYFLVDQMDEHNAVMCSYQVLEEVLSICKETVRKNVKVLKDNHFIVILKSGTSNVYAINDSVYWKSWGNKKKYSKFPANVVLALSEQEQGYQMSLDFDANIETVKHKEVIVAEEKPTLEA